MPVTDARNAMTTRLKARNKNKFWRPNMSAMNFISQNGTTLEAFEETDLDHTRCKSEAPRALNSPRRGISGFQEGGLSLVPLPAGQIRSFGQLGRALLAG